MNKFLIFLMASLTTSYLLKGQCDVRMNDICTPNGSQVVTFLMCESSLATRLYWDNYYAQTYPNATQIKTHSEQGYEISSTRKFNCHGYAWLRVEKEIDRWIGTGWPEDINNPELVYMTDGSYVEVSQMTYPGKVFWPLNDDHSAVTTSEQGVFISKWNEFPLMRHQWNYSPYGSSNLKYYKLAWEISGPSVVCSSGATFTINNPSGSSVTWAKSSNLTYVSGQGTSSFVVQSGDIGAAWVRASVSTSCDTIELPTYFVWSGVPVVESNEILAYYPYAWNDVCKLQTKTTNMNVQGESSLYWEKLTSSPSNISWYQTGDNVSFYFWDIGQTSVFEISAANTCGSLSYSFGFRSIDCGGDPCDPEYLISPNPTSGSITIVPNLPPPCDEYVMENSQITAVKIYNTNGQVKKSFKYGKMTNHVEIDLSDLMPGTYFVDISDGVKSVRKIVIIPRQ